MSERWIEILELFRRSVNCVSYYFDTFHRLPWPLPGEEGVIDLLSELEFANERDWNSIRSHLDVEIAARLLTLSLRMATLAVREKHTAYLPTAATALILDRDLLDARDVLRATCVLWDAAHRVGTSIAPTLKQAAIRATPLRSRVLTSFLEGPDYMKSLRSMGFEAVSGPEGFLYKEIGVI